MSKNKTNNGLTKQDLVDLVCHDLSFTEAVLTDPFSLNMLKAERIVDRLCRTLKEMGPVCFTEDEGEVLGWMPIINELPDRSRAVGYQVDIKILLQQAFDALEATEDSEIFDFEDEEEEAESAPIQYACRKIMEAIDLLAGDQAPYVVEPDNKETTKTLHIHTPVCERFTATLVSESGKILQAYDDLPDFMPGEHYGDYLILDIDINTGQITNWQAPSREQIEQFIGDGSEG